MSAHPTTYKAYAFLEQGADLQPITVDWKDPQPGEIVVKVLACGVCASDEAVKHQLVPITYPRIPGHEIVGEVVAVHPSEKLWKIGARVGGGWHGGHCNECERCRAGDHVTCANEDVNGVLRDGGYAEYSTLRSEAVAAVPEELDPAEAAPLLCAGVTVFNSLRHSNALPPAWVAVQGIGGLGHLGLQFARKMGYRVVALSSGPTKQQLAIELGAHVYVDGSKEDQALALAKLGGAQVIMATAPNSQIFQDLVPTLNPGGELLVLALTPEAKIPLVPMITRRLTVRGFPAGTAADSEDTMKFVVAHNVKVMVQKFPLDKAQEAYDHRSSARFRAVIIP